MLPELAFARDQIRVVGSATVYPFITAAAEQFGQEGRFKTPIVEATGTGGGFKLFCQGAGIDSPDINNASRKITASEIEQCKKNGVLDIVEIPLGYDGIVIANKKDAASLNVYYKQIFMALARDVVDASGNIVKNNYDKWSDIDPTLPNFEIKIYGPPPTSGTRDTFVELAMEKGCAEFPEFSKRTPDEKERKKLCHLLREDGKYVEAGENYNIVIQKLTSDDRSFGIMGFGFYDENTAKIQAVNINHVSPDMENIASSKYALSRTLYMYVKGQHVGKVPGITEFIDEVASEGATGQDGYMTAKGLVPLSVADRNTVLTTADSLRRNAH